MTRRALKNVIPLTVDLADRLRAVLGYDIRELALPPGLSTDGSLVDHTDILNPGTLSSADVGKAFVLQEPSPGVFEFQLLTVGGGGGHGTTASVRDHSDVDSADSWGDPDDIGRVLVWDGTEFLLQDVPIGGGLQASNNLNDVNSAATSRTNLGLGNSATRNVGSTSADVAVGNHTHTIYLQLAGGTMSGPIAMGNNEISGLKNGTASADAVNKSQLDSAAPAALTDGSILQLHGHRPVLVDDMRSSDAWTGSTNGSGSRFHQDQSTSSTWIKNDPARYKYRVTVGSGSAATDRARLYSEQWDRGSDWTKADIAYSFRVGLDGSSNYRHFVELIRTNGNTLLPTPYIAVDFDSANSNLHFRTDDGSSSNNVDVGSDGALSNFHSAFAWLTISVENGGTELALYLGTTEIHRLTTNLPTNAFIVPALSSHGNGNSWRSIYLSCFVQSLPYVDGIPTLTA